MYLERGPIEILRLRAQTVLESGNDTAASNLRIFFEFIDENLLFKEIIEELGGDGLPDFGTIKHEIVTRLGFQFPSNFREKIRVCLSALNLIMDKVGAEPCHIVVDAVGAITNIDAMAQVFVEQFFRPVYNYIIERIIQIDALLYMIIRFKAYSEWYKKEELHHLYISDTTKGEYNLDKKFREFLFESGIDYPYSKPISPEGETDILTVIRENPIPLELKIFTGDNRAHIKQGFTQAYLYSRDYNTPTGYLVVFNVSEKELKFSLTSAEVPQRITFGDKTIFVITINIFPHEEPASRRRLETYEITEKELIAHNSLLVI